MFVLKNHMLFREDCVVRALEFYAAAAATLFCFISHRIISTSTYHIGGLDVYLARTTISNRYLLSSIGLVI